MLMDSLVRLSRSASNELRKTEQNLHAVHIEYMKSAFGACGSERRAGEGVELVARASDHIVIV